MSFRLEKLKILNYKSILEAEITFEKGLNIFIGENGSGKSNALQFIYTFVGITRFSNQRFIRNLKFPTTSYAFDLAYIDKNEKSKFRLSFDVNFKKGLNDKNEFSNLLNFERFENKVLQYNENYRFDSLENAFKTVALSQELNILKGIRKKYIRFNLPDDLDSSWVAFPNKFEMDSRGFVEMDGLSAYTIFYTLDDLIENLAVVNFQQKEKEILYQNLKDSVNSLFDEFKKSCEIDKYLNQYSPIQEMRLNKNINIFSDDIKIFVENLIIEFKIQEKWVSWNYLSDGTKRLFYLITEAIALKKGILLIEEPELGIHPHQLYSVMNFLKEQSSSKQIIISTHSPIVLDILKPEELKSIIITKMTADGTKLSKLNRKETAKAKEYIETTGDLSTYWLHSDLEKND